MNLARNPRNGRAFEYAEEDPLLAGAIVGNRMKCEQAQHVIGDIKHYVKNDQETGRNIVNVIISKHAMQGSDLSEGSPASREHRLHSPSRLIGKPARQDILQRNTALRMYLLPLLIIRRVKGHNPFLMRSAGLKGDGQRFGPQSP